MVFTAFFFRFPTQLVFSLVVAVVALFFSYSSIDLKFATLFYDFSTHQWMARNHPFSVRIYQYFPFIFLFFIFLCLVALLYGYILAPNLQKKRIWAALGAMLTSSLLVELLKNSIDRTRPYDLKQFGALYDYLPIGFFTYSLDGIHFSSFPSGHAASGFGLGIFLYFFFPDPSQWGQIQQDQRKNSNQLLGVWGFYGLSLLMGVSLSLARLMQGGHFLSDLLVSFALCSLVNACFGQIVMGAWGKKNGASQWEKGWAILFPPIKNQKPEFSHPKLRFSFWILSSCVLFLGGIFGYLVNFYHDERWEKTIPYQSEMKIEKIDPNAEETLIFEKNQQPEIKIRFEANGKDFPWSGLEPIFFLEDAKEGKVLKLGWKRGKFSHSFNGKIKVFLP